MIENGDCIKSEKNNEFSSLFAQILASISKYLIMLDIGMCICFSTIAIPPLEEAKTGLKLTREEASWFASLVFIWQPVGSLASIPLSGLGRKRSMLYFHFPLIIGWIMPYFASTVIELYISTSLIGLGIGFLQAPITTYIGEVIEPKYRGTLASIAYIFLTLGGVLIFSLDYITGDWRVSSLYCTIIPPLTMLFLALLPESPIWLISQHRITEAKESLKWLRGWTTDEAVDEEFRTMMYQNCKHLSPLNEKEPDEAFYKYIIKPEMYKPLILILIFFYLSNGISVAIIRSYLVLIFEFFQVNINETVATIGVSCLGVFANILCTIFIPIVGKKKLALLSIILSTIGVCSIGIYALIGSKKYSWILVMIMMELFFAYNLGVGHLPWVLISEIFPLKGKTFAAGLVAGVANFMQFLGIKLFWTYVDWFTLSGTFFMYGITYCLGFIYLYLFLFETENISLHDIMLKFKNG